MQSFYRPHSRVQFTGELVDPATGEVTSPPSMTQQSFVKECDINNIIKQFSQTGMITHISERAAEGAYVDLPESMDFQEALHTVEAARASFASLPSKVRDRFGNSPEAFLEFLHNPSNEDEARSLGLLNPKVAPQEGGSAGGGTPPAEAAPAA